MKKRILSLAVAALMLAGLLGGCAQSAPAASAASADPTAAQAAEATGGETRLVILHTNDTHGRVVGDDSEPAWGYARIARQKELYEEQGYDVLLLSAGDVAQGMPIVNLSQGQSAIEFMNLAGYDAMCPGNHEFDWGSDNALALAETAEFPVLSANLTRKADGTLLFEDHTVFTFDDGVKVGVFGLTTPTTSTSVRPDRVADVNFAGGEDMYQIARDQVAALQAEDCDLIVCLGHLGTDEAAQPDCSTDVLAQVEGIDLFIDGHSHTEIVEQEGDTLLVSTGCYGHNLGKVEWDGQSLTGELLPALDEDATVAEAVNTLNEEILAQLSEPFASTTVDLNGEREPGVRTEETNLGDFCADALLWRAEDATGLDIDCAIVNGGGIRASIPAGDITMNDMKTVFPFDNTIYVVQVTGAELLESLECATGYIPEAAAGAFPQVAGLEFTIDISKPFATTETYPDSNYGKPDAPGDRVSIASIGDGEFDPEALYYVATNDFIATGGDAYYVFRYAGETASISTGVALEDALIDYVNDELGGVIGEQYAEPAGRIHIIGG